MQENEMYEVYELVRVRLMEALKSVSEGGSKEGGVPPLILWAMFLRCMDTLYVITKTYNNKDSSNNH